MVTRVPPISIGDSPTAIVADEVAILIISSAQILHPIIIVFGSLIQ